MSKHYPLAHPNHSNWQLLTELLVPNLQEAESEIVDHVADVLHQFNLEPGQLDQILAAISQTLATLEDSFTSLHLRISMSGVDLTEVRPKADPQGDFDRDHDSQRTGGLGFFVVRRIVEQLQEQDPKRYRLVEVLLYRE